VSKKDKPAPPIVLRSVPADKPDLVVHAADLTVTARALAKLLAKQCENLFVHDRKPVLVLPDQDDGAPVIQSVSVAEVIIAAHKVCQPVKRKSSDRLEVTLPDKVAELYLAMPDEWRLRPLTSFSSSPMLDADGAIRCENGYDATTGVYLYKVPKITLPDKPSRQDAMSARATLRHAFRTFPFADRVAIDETFSVDGGAINVEVVDLKQQPGKDESAFLVALLTAVCRSSLLIAPVIAVRGVKLSGSGVGKKLLFNSATMIAYGQRASSAALGRKEEFEKGLVAALIRPDPCVTIDNINGRKLQSETLCTALSDRPALLRVLGMSELKQANERMLVGITGNAFTISEDLIRRQFVIELDARVENPEQRKFAGNFLADITAQRTELLQAALTIWRFGRQNAATLTRGQPLGGFEEWSAWARDPLLALGCHDPVTEIAKMKTSDPIRLETVEIFQAWWEHHKDGAVIANDLDHAVKVLLVPKAKEPSRQAVASRVANLDGTRLAGFHLTSNKENRGRWTTISYKLEFTEPKSEQATEEPEPDFGPEPSPQDPPPRQQSPPQEKPKATPEPAKAPITEAAGGSDFPYHGPVVTPPDLGPDSLDEHGAPSEPDDADDWQFNREPDAAAARPEPAAAKAAQDAPPPADPVARWRAGFARLDPLRDPCAGLRPHDWPNIYKAIATFLAGPLAKIAADLGWKDLELFGVHPKVGVARPNACGVLMANTRGGPVTNVTSNFLQFGNLIGRKTTLDLNESVEVWKWNNQ